MMKKLFLLFCFFFTVFCSAQNFTLGDSVFHRNDLLRATSVRYEYGKGRLNPASYPFLDSVLTFLTKHDTLKIEIAVHTDTRTSDASSMRLSKVRANSVRDYLISKGIAAARLTAVGYEGKQPIISKEEISKMKTKSEQEAAHQKNRRTEFRIL